MIIKIWTKDQNMAPIEFSVPVTSEVEIHLFPGDKPTIEPHNTRSVDEHKCRSFDVIVKPNGELMMDWVNVTQTADSTVGKLIERHVKKREKVP